MTEEEWILYKHGYDDGKEQGRYDGIVAILDELKAIKANREELGEEFDAIGEIEEYLDMNYTDRDNAEEEEKITLSIVRMKGVE